MAKKVEKQQSALKWSSQTWAVLRSPASLTFRGSSGSFTTKTNQKATNRRNRMAGNHPKKPNPQRVPSRVPTRPGTPWWRCSGRRRGPGWQRSAPPAGRGLGTVCGFWVTHVTGRPGNLRLTRSTSLNMDPLKMGRYPE